MTSRLYPPPPHLAKGHNCPNPRSRSLSSGALDPPKPARSKERGGAHSRPHPRQADHARNPRIRCTGAAGNHHPPPPPLREATPLKQRPGHPNLARNIPTPPLFSKRTYLSQLTMSHNPKTPPATAHTNNPPAHKKGGPHNPLRIAGPSLFGVCGTLLTLKAPPPITHQISG